MALLQIDHSTIPSLHSKAAIVTGGSSGIGWATVQLLSQHGARVTILDISPPPTTSDSHLPQPTFIPCDVSSWKAIKAVFQQVGHIDFAFANAAVREHKSFLNDAEEDGGPAEPDYRVFDINLRGVLNVVKCSWFAMKRQNGGGSIVLTTSNLAYSPTPWLPIYSSTKLALVGLVRSLRSISLRDNITINAVAPSPTSTPVLPPTFHRRLTSAGVPVSSPGDVALALVYSATATAIRPVVAHGKEDGARSLQEERWNGRVILVLGDRYTELEEPIEDLRSSWMGKENLELSRVQQGLLDGGDIST